MKFNPPNIIRTGSQREHYESLYDDLVDGGALLKEQDRHALGIFAINMALLDTCAESIEEEGMMMNVKGDKGGKITKVNPAIALQKEAQTAVRFYFVQFDMTPKSRGTNGGLGGLGALPRDSAGNDQSERFKRL